MSIKLSRRIAAELMGRGISKVRIKPDRVEDAKKAITREDVRALISSGAVYALKAKHNMSLYSKDLREKRNKGRAQGSGKEEGIRKGEAVGRLREEDKGPEEGAGRPQEGEGHRQRRVQEVLQAGQGRQLPDQGLAPEPPHHGGGVKIDAAEAGAAEAHVML